MKLDAAYWTSRYESGDVKWDIGSVSTPIRTYIDQLENKDLRILIPGAGNAYEAEYLVSNGFKNVFVCDLSPAPLENLRKRCPSMRDEQLILGNFFSLQGKFDLMIEQTFFCAIDPSLRADYFRQAHRLLSPGGVLAGVLFNDTLNADQPPFGGNELEYRELASPLFRISVLDKCYNSIPPREGRELFMIMRPAQ